MRSNRRSWRTAKISMKLMCISLNDVNSSDWTEQKPQRLLFGQIECAVLPRDVALGIHSFRARHWRPRSLRDQEWMVERIGIEPMTPCLQSRCSPS